MVGRRHATLKKEPALFGTGGYFPLTAEHVARKSGCFTALLILARVMVMIVLMSAAFALGGGRGVVVVVEFHHPAELLVQVLVEPLPLFL